MSEKVCNQCIAKTANGRRCKRRTCRTKYCWTHLMKEKGLKIAESNIPDAGLGLFAVKNFAYNRTIAPYDGIIRNHNSNNPYVLELAPDKFVDAARTDNIGRWANHCKSENRRRGQCPGNNAKLTGSRGRLPNVTATKTIRADKKHPKEIFCNYGRDYFPRRVKSI